MKIVENSRRIIENKAIRFPITYRMEKSFINIAGLSYELKCPSRKEIDFFGLSQFKRIGGLGSRRL